MDLRNALQTRFMGENVLPDALNALVPALVARFNSEVAPRLLSRLATEETPTEPRQASSFRARVSLLVEYSLIEMLADFLRADAPGLHITYNTTNQFADLFLRNDDWVIELRLDIKTLHDLSVEASARFSERTDDILPLDDYLLFVAWQWREFDHEGVAVIAPAVLGAVFIPAIEVAEERDKRQILTGGSFDGEGLPLAASGLHDTNFGKMNRIVHPDRRDAPDLAPRLRELLKLMTVQADARAEIPAPLAAMEVLADIADATGSADVTAETDEA